MNRHLTVLVLLTAAAQALAATTISSVEKPASPHARHAQEGIQNATSLRPFALVTLDQEVVSPQYAGVSIKAVVEALEEKTGQKKGEFESTAQFNQRRKAALEGSLVGEIRTDDVLAFVFAVQKKSHDVPFYYTYDADTQEAMLTVSADQTTLNKNEVPSYSAGAEPLPYDNYPIASESGPPSKYTIRNVDVTKLDSTIYSFATSRSRGFSLKAPMDAKRAESELPTLKALLLVKLRDPYLAYDFEYVEPTRIHPVELTKRTRALVGDILGVVFYSGKSGQIVAKSLSFKATNGTFAEPDRSKRSGASQHDTRG